MKFIFSYVITLMNPSDKKEKNDKMEEIKEEEEEEIKIEKMEEKEEIKIEKMEEEEIKMEKKKIIEEEKKKLENESMEIDEYELTPGGQHMKSKTPKANEELEELPEEVEFIVDILVELGKEPKDFQGEFIELIKPHFDRKINEKKQQESINNAYLSAGYSSSNYSTGGGYSSYSYSDHLEEDDTTSLDNANFYQGKSKPGKTNDPLVDELHKKWLGEWDLLEDRHNYVQFLFPIRESGMSSAQVISIHKSRR
jgi:hypothetical protein